MSTLFVDTINEKTSGNGIKIPGHVVQYASNTEGGSISSTSTSYVASGANISFTPKYSNSKIIITVQSRRFNIYNSETLLVKLMRDGATNVSVDGTEHVIVRRNQNSSASNQISDGLSYMWQDAPNTTSAVSYEIYYKVNTGTGFMADGGGIQYYVMEIAQ